MPTAWVLSFNSFYNSRFCRIFKVFLESGLLNYYFPSNSWYISNSFSTRYWQIEKYFVESRAQRFDKIIVGIGPIVFFVSAVICPIYFFSYPFLMLFSNDFSGCSITWGFTSLSLLTRFRFPVFLDTLFTRTHLKVLSYSRKIIQGKGTKRLYRQRKKEKNISIF